jgi:hypothetical protein
MRELSARCIEMCKKHNLTDAEFAASWIEGAEEWQSSSGQVAVE